MFKSLALTLNGRMRVGEVKSAEEDVAADFGVNSFPTLIAIEATGERHTFTGKLSICDGKIYVLYVTMFIYIYVYIRRLTC